MADAVQIATQFVQYYYSVFDTSRSNIGSVYRDPSMLTFEGTQFQGAANIAEKLVALPFSKVQHQIDTFDVQPTGASQDGLLIVVTGRLVVDNEANALKFSQTFVLQKDGADYWVLNDVFRLNYG